MCFCFSGVAVAIEGTFIWPLNAPGVESLGAKRALIGVCVCVCLGSQRQIRFMCARHVRCCDASSDLFASCSAPNLGDLASHAPSALSEPFARGGGKLDDHLGSFAKWGAQE